MKLTMKKIFFNGLYAALIIQSVHMAGQDSIYALRKDISFSKQMSSIPALDTPDIKNEMLEEKIEKLYADYREKIATLSNSLCFIFNKDGSKLSSLYRFFSWPLQSLAQREEKNKQSVYFSPTMSMEDKNEVVHALARQCDACVHELQAHLNKHESRLHHNQTTDLTNVTKTEWESLIKNVKSLRPLAEEIDFHRMRDTITTMLMSAANKINANNNDKLLPFKLKLILEYICAQQQVYYFFKSEFRNKDKAEIEQELRFDSLKMRYTAEKHWRYYYNNYWILRWFCKKPDDDAFHKIAMKYRLLKWRRALEERNLAGFIIPVEIRCADINKQKDFIKI